MSNQKNNSGKNNNMLTEGYSGLKNVRPTPPVNSGFRTNGLNGISSIRPPQQGSGQDSGKGKKK